MDRRAEFEGAFRAQIGRFRAPLVPELRRFLRVQPPPRAALVMFEVYSDWRSFAVSAFAFDRDWVEVSAGTPFQEARPRIPGELVPEGAIDQDAFEDDGVATFETGAVLLAELFHQCWREAGGTGYPLPAYIKHHDRGTALDLGTGGWVRTRDLLR